MQREDRDDRIARLERSVLLMVEVLENVIDAVSLHQHEGEWSYPGHGFRLALDRVAGRLDAVTGLLGVGSARDAVGRDGTKAREVDDADR